VPAESLPRAPSTSAPSLFKSPPAAPRESDYDPTKPSVDPEAAKRRAGEIAREGMGQRAILPFPLPAKAPPKTKMETAIENARKPDCRNAYANLGLLAVVPLIANEFGEGSCRW
jgi:hypothetical protein